MLNNVKHLRRAAGFTNLLARQRCFTLFSMTLYFK